MCYRLFMFMAAGAYRRVGLVYAIEMFREQHMSCYNLGYNTSPHVKDHWPLHCSSRACRNLDYRLTFDDWVFNYCVTVVGLFSQ